MPVIVSSSRSRCSSSLQQRRSLGALFSSCIPPQKACSLNVFMPLGAACNSHLHFRVFHLLFPTAVGQPPEQLAWCGSDSLIASWEVGS